MDGRFPEEDEGILMTTPTPAWLALAHYCHAYPSRGRDDALVVAGAWDAIMGQHSAADLKPVRVRDGRREERRRAG